MPHSKRSKPNSLAEPLHSDDNFSSRQPDHTNAMPHASFLQDVQARTSALLDQYLPSEAIEPRRLHRAMRYSAQNPGKRLRPALVFATGEMLGAALHNLNPVAVAVELIHAYSLIHDDLPCMDDDDLRRGIPTCHIAFDEATAVLAGDALQTLAFEILTTDEGMTLQPQDRLRLLSVLAKASGSLGMGGGQAIDLAMTNRADEDSADDLATLEAMHKMKTGALISAAVELGFIAAECQDPAIKSALDHYSADLGLAFQIRDDILDIESDTATLGKPQGSDVDKNKLTFPALLGLEGAKARAHALVESALEALSHIPYNSAQLAHFAHYIINRNF